MSLRLLFVLSLVVGAVELGGFIVFRYEPMLSRWLFVGLWLAAAWLLLFGIAVAKYRRRSLWLLFSAPIGLWVPLMWSLIYLACAYGHDCL